MLKILHQTEVLQVLRLLDKGKKRVTWLQDRGNVNLERKTLHTCIDQLSHMGLITREYETDGGIDYIVNKITPKGQKLLVDKIPLKLAHKIRM